VGVENEVRSCLCDVARSVKTGEVSRGNELTNSGGVLILVNGGVSIQVEGDRGLGAAEKSESAPITN
jgi:hypothetical protein